MPEKEPLLQDQIIGMLTAREARVRVDRNENVVFGVYSYFIVEPGDVLLKLKVIVLKEGMILNRANSQIIGEVWLSPYVDIETARITHWKDRYPELTVTQASWAELAEIAETLPQTHDWVPAWAHQAVAGRHYGALGGGAVAIGSGARAVSSGGSDRKGWRFAGISIFSAQTIAITDNKIIINGDKLEINPQTGVVIFTDRYSRRREFPL